MKLFQYLERTQQLRATTNKPAAISRFRDIPFVCKYDSVQCIGRCFNHLIGLPTRDNEPRPVYQWQYDHIISQLEQHKYNWIKKASGIGATEIILRWILYKCLVDNELSNGIVCYVTGPNIDLAKRLIDRSYNLIYDFFPNAKQNDYRLTVNNVEISAFPSNHVEAFRSLVNVKFILLDEADFFRQSDQDEVRVTAERYIAKSDVHIAMVSTPNLPGGLFERIEREQPSIYNKTLLPYTVALGTIFTQKQIAEQRRSYAFEREYNLQYLGNIGNIFNPIDIDYITNDKYTLTDSDTEYYTRYLGCDMGFGSSNFAITIVQIKDKIEVVYSEEYERPEYETMVSLVHQLIQRYHCCKGFFDSSNPGFISSIKRKYGSSEYQKYWILDPEVVERWVYSDCTENKIVPIVWRTKHIQMLQHLHKLISTRNIRIAPKFDKLITSLKTATSKNDKFDLDKSQTSYNDSLDSLQLAVLPIGFT